MASCMHLLLAVVATPSTTYRAAVATLTWRHNIGVQLDHYEALARNASRQGAKIIVFPEAGVWDGDTRKSALKDAQAVPRIGSVPCDVTAATDHMPQVTRLSCIAREAHIVVVANVISRVPCSGKACPSDGFYLYNSDVVHDERGSVLATYFKRHRYRPFDIHTIKNVNIFIHHYDMFHISDP